MLISIMFYISYNKKIIETIYIYLIKLDNKILAGFLYSRIKSVNILDVDFRIVIEDYGFKLDIKDYELVEIAGNLINNAFETKVVDNVVILILKKDSISKIFKKGFSTKSNVSRGYGLNNVKEIVKKYNGQNFYAIKFRQIKFIFKVFM